MAIKFSIHETPQPKDRKGEALMHARAIPRGTKRMDDLCEIICERSSITSADVKAVLDSFVWVIGHSLGYGDHVELEDLGHFSPSLHTQKGANNKMTVKVDGVNFRCSEKLKKKLRHVTLEKQAQAGGYSLQERKKRMQDYLEHNETITTPLYAKLNNCSYYKAAEDLRQFIEEGSICRLGNSTHIVFVSNTNIIREQ